MNDAHTVARKSRSSFYWAMRLLPAAKREAMFALYAYCRGLDDIADGPLDTETKRARLAVLRGVVAALYETGVALDPLVAPLAPAVARYTLPRAELEALIDGMEMDVNGPLTAPSPELLGLYCRRVAGAVGLLAVRIFGRPDADRFAVLLGEALQLTNILRDVREDLAEGRLYLPEDALESATIITRDPAVLAAHPGLARACRFLARLAEQRFAEARAELARIGRHGLWPAVAMMEIYHAQLALLVSHDWNAGPQPRVGRFHRLLIALRCAAAG